MDKVLALLNAVNGNRAEAISLVALASMVAGVKLDGDQGTAAAYALAFLLTAGDLAIRFARAHSKPAPAVVHVSSTTGNGAAVAAQPAPALPPAPVA